jgi:hypothetical protein
VQDVTARRILLGTSKTEEDTMSDTVTSVEKHGTESVVDQAEVGKLLVNGGSLRYEVEWDAEARVTPMGSLVFFAQYLQTGD